MIRGEDIQLIITHRDQGILGLYSNSHNQEQIYEYKTRCYYIMRERVRERFIPF